MNTFGLIILVLVIIVCNLFVRLEMFKYCDHSILDSDIAKFPIDNSLKDTTHFRTSNKSRDFKTYTIITQMCGKDGTEEQRGNMTSIEWVQSRFFGPDPETMESYTNVVTYGLYSFTRENNIIYGVVDMTEWTECGDCKNGIQSCSCYGWNKWYNSKDGPAAFVKDHPDHQRIFSIPSIDACHFGGETGISVKGIGLLRGLRLWMHELAHELWLCPHDASICVADTCEGDPLFVKEYGDEASVMGNGSTIRTFFSAPSAHRVLGIVKPIATYQLGSSRTIPSIIIPALERSNQNCVWIKGDPTKHDYYISYRQKNDHTCHKGLYNLDQYDDMIHVHMFKNTNSGGGTDPNNNFIQSIRVAVIRQGVSKDISYLSSSPAIRVEFIRANSARTIAEIALTIYA